MIRTVILNSHRKIEKWSEQKLRQTRRRTQAGLTPGKDDNEVWHHFCRSRLKVSMGVQYKTSNGSAAGSRHGAFYPKRKDCLGAIRQVKIVRIMEIFLDGFWPKMHDKPSDMACIFLVNSV